jgi:hypothetical protein
MLPNGNISIRPGPSVAGALADVLCALFRSPVVFFREQ